MFISVSVSASSLNANFSGFLFFLDLSRLHPRIIDVKHFFRVLFSGEFFTLMQTSAPPMMKKKSRKRKYHAKPAKPQRRPRISQDRKR